MKKKLVLLIGFVGIVHASQQRTLVHSLLTENDHCFDDLATEMKWELGSWILHDHPIVDFLERELSRVTKSIPRGFEQINSVQFSHLGDKIVTASSSKKAKIWDAAGCCCLSELSGHIDNVYSAEFNQAGTKVVTASRDWTAKIWNAQHSICERTLGQSEGIIGRLFSFGHWGEVTSAKFNRAGDKVVTGSFDRTAKIWDVASGTCLHTLFGHTDFIRSVAFNFQGDKVVTASSDNTAKIWDAAQGMCAQTLPGHTSFIWSAQFNSVGDKVVTTSDDATIKIWNVANGACLYTFVGTDRFTVAECSPSGDKVVMAPFGNTAKICDLTAGNCVCMLVGHSDRIISVHFSCSGNKIITGSLDATVKIWDAHTGECLHTLRSPDRNGCFAQINGSEDFVVSTSSSGQNLWNVKKLTELKHFLKENITHKQALLLIAIYEAHICSTLVKKHGEEAFTDRAHSVSESKVTFDFNKFPHMQADYDNLPDEIKTILDPYVRKVGLSSVMEYAWDVLRNVARYFRS